MAQQVKSLAYTLNKAIKKIENGLYSQGPIHGFAQQVTLPAEPFCWILG